MTSAKKIKEQASEYSKLFPKITWKERDVKPNIVEDVNVAFELITKFRNELALRNLVAIMAWQVILAGVATWQRAALLMQDFDHDGNILKCRPNRELPANFHYEEGDATVRGSVPDASCTYTLVYKGYYILQGGIGVSTKVPSRVFDLPKS